MDVGGIGMNPQPVGKVESNACWMHLAMNSFFFSMVWVNGMPDGLPFSEIGPHLPKDRIRAHQDMLSSGRVESWWKNQLLPGCVLNLKSSNGSKSRETC